MTGAAGGTGPGPRVLRVSGPSGSGKTSLLLRLLPRLPVSAREVGLVKHTHHAVDWHPAGKDSRLLWDADPGALCVAGPDQAALFLPDGGREDDPGPREARDGSDPAGDATRRLVRACRRLPGRLRLILAEGFREARAPGIWTAAAPPDGPGPGPAIRAAVVPASAVAAWQAARPELEVHPREAAAELADRVVGWAAPLSELSGG